MLLALQNAIDTLLKSALSSLFTGAGAAAATFSADAWDFDRLSADPIAGEPGPEDAVDELVFDPAAPAGPYVLTRPPYPGPKRVYLRSTSGELVALRHAEVVWNPADPASFLVVPAAGRALAGIDHLHVMYGVVAAATRIQSLHKLTMAITGADAVGEIAIPHSSLSGSGVDQWWVRLTLADPTDTTGLTIAPVGLGNLLTNLSVCAAGTVDQLDGCLLYTSPSPRD